LCEMFLPYFSTRNKIEYILIFLNVVRGGPLFAATPANQRTLVIILIRKRFTVIWAIILAPLSPAKLLQEKLKNTHSHSLFHSSAVFGSSKSKVDVRTADVKLSISSSIVQIALGMMVSL
jgi:hypothetical protein